MVKNSELKGAHFEIFQGFSSNFAKNVRFLYYREANKKRHVPLKPRCTVLATLSVMRVRFWQLTRARSYSDQTKVNINKQSVKEFFKII